MLVEFTKMRVLGSGEYEAPDEKDATKQVRYKSGEKVRYIDVYDPDVNGAVQFPVDEKLVGDAAKLSFGDVISGRMALIVRQSVGTARGGNEYVKSALKGRIVGMEVDAGARAKQAA